MSPDSGPADAAEHRRAPRTRCLRQARCVFHKGFSVLDVTVRNASATGARISGDELICLPDEFELGIHDGYGEYKMRRVRLVWRREKMAGVQYIDGR